LHFCRLFFAGDKPNKKFFPQKAANSVFKFYYSEYFVLIAGDFLANNTIFKI
jgi:hypothetical protein